MYAESSQVSPFARFSTGYVFKVIKPDLKGKWDG